MGSSPEIRSLTGIRGVAALAVVLYHFDLGQPDSGPLQHVLHHGYLAVDLFFVLSGFVMALTYGRAFVLQPDIEGFGRFLEHRLARIYPLYLVTTLLPLAVEGAPVGAVSERDIVANLLMIQAWGVGPSLNADAWSISTEWLAYLIFPLLAWLALGSRTWPALLLAALSAALLTALALNPDLSWWRDAQLRQGPLDRAEPTAHAALLRCVAEFALGLLAYRIWTLKTSLPILRTVRFELGLGIGLIGLLAIQNADLIIVLLLPAFIVALADDAGPIARLLGSAPIYRLGVLSYALYLIHPLVLWRGQAYFKSAFLAAGLPGASWAGLVITLMAILALSWTANLAIERPSRAAIRRLLDATPRSAKADADR
jgi:peptidoglycan/LPS O-acetylase OafA/YrhL